MEGGKTECAVGNMVGNGSAIPGRHALILSMNWSATNGRQAELTCHTRKETTLIRDDTDHTHLCQMGHEPWSVSSLRGLLGRVEMLWTENNLDKHSVPVANRKHSLLYKGHPVYV